MMSQYQLTKICHRNVPPFGSLSGSWDISLFCDILFSIKSSMNLVCYPHSSRTVGHWCVVIWWAHLILSHLVLRIQISLMLSLDLSKLNWLINIQFGLYSFSGNVPFWRHWYYFPRELSLHSNWVRDEFFGISHFTKHHDCFSALVICTSSQTCHNVISRYFDLHCCDMFDIARLHLGFSFSYTFLFHACFNLF